MRDNIDFDFDYQINTRLKFIAELLVREKIDFFIVMSDFMFHLEYAKKAKRENN